MGVDSLGELDKPKPNRWIESKIQEGVFGGEGAGLEAVAAGGLHTLFIDENGVVSARVCLSSQILTDSSLARSGLVA